MREFNGPAATLQASRYPGRCPGMSPVCGLLLIWRHVMTCVIPASKKRIKIVDGVTGPKAGIANLGNRVKNAVIWDEHDEMFIVRLLSWFHS
jgi:hypothetical protein